MTNKYAKLITETQIEFAPKNKGEILNYNLNVEQMLKDGYKPFIEANKEIGKSYNFSYEETESEIKEIITEIIPEPIDEEAERRKYLDSLKLSCCDVEHALYQARGIDFDDLKEIIKEKAPSIDIKDIGIELKRGTFDRNNPYINQIGTLLGYSQDDLDYLFENKKLPIIETIKTEEIKEAQEDGI